MVSSLWARLKQTPTERTAITFIIIIFITAEAVSMFLLRCITSLTLLLVAESGVGSSNSSSSYCTESKECLQFELVCQTEEYEVRHYSPTWWVSTDAEAYLMGVGAAMAFRRLYQYITGSNQAGVQMEMTAPVLVEVPENTHTWEPALYTLSFLLPSVFQGERPPAPTNDKLYFTEMPEMNVYVRSFGGWMLSVSSRLHTHLLTKELQRVNASYNHTHHYAVGYDSPLKLLHRHNEVWYLVNGVPVCNGTMPKTTQDTTANTATASTATVSTATASNATASNATSPASTDPTAAE